MAQALLRSGLPGLIIAAFLLSKMESLQQRREELERKECDLKEQLLKFDHFLKVCRMVFF
jgi:hypothetical protein